MQNDEKDDGYSEEWEPDSCLKNVFGHHGEIDESMISHVPGSSMNGERMTIRLLADYAEAAHVPIRQQAAKQILEALQFAVTSVEAYCEQEDVEKVFAYINKLSQDSEAVVRCNLLTALMKVASFCAEYDSPLVSLKELIDTDILPIVLKAIADEDRNCNMRVRKEGYTVLKYLLNKNLVSQNSIEDKISDLCTSFLFHSNDVMNLITAGNFIARMPPVVGEATTEKLLLPKISELCTNQYSKVREACVFFLMDLACHVDPLVTENVIIPLFIKLSEDEAWCVRKACAETIVMLSCLCLMETRKTVLTRAFLNLLPDRDGPVISVAYKQLGPFMATFSQPALIALGSNRSGDYVLIHCQSGSKFELMSRRMLFQFYEQPEQNTFYMFMLPMMKTADNGVNQTSDAKISETESSQQMTETDMHNNDSIFCSDDVDVEEEKGIDKRKARKSSVPNEFHIVRKRSYASSENYTENNVEEPYFDFENFRNEKNRNYIEQTNLDSSGDQFQCESDDRTDDDEFKNQPDLVQSCLKVPDDRKLRKLESIRCQKVAEGSDERFNSFQFWREPIPEFDDRDLTSTRLLECHDNNISSNDECEKHESDIGERYEFDLNDINRNGIDCNSSWMNIPFDFPFDYFPPGSYRKLSDSSEKNDKRVTRGVKTGNMSINVASKQNVLPQALLNAYNDMVSTPTFDVKVHCAYNFPAVALTMGADNWYLLKDTYAKLATDSERQIRQMVAGSIHEIASILGPELATADLIPIYNSLINDVEDIRIAALNHLSCFVRLLKPHGRCQFLPHLMDYMMTDYAWNWRFRKQLSEQLIEMMDFFAPNDCWKYVSPVAFSLLMDRVSAVRLQALNLVTHLIRVVSVDLITLRGILGDLAEQFAHSTHWTRRQSFAFLCSSLLRTPVLPDDMFARDVLPHLLDLSWDSIPNVRIAVARTLSCDVITYPYFSNVFSPHYDVLAQVLKRLFKDKDRDVRYFASLNTSALPPLTKFESLLG